MSWDEYREERQRAKEQRKLERQQQGKSGPLATVMEWVEGKKKSD